MSTAPHIVNVGYRSTNYWVIAGQQSHLLVDLGWPGLVQPLLHNLKRAGFDTARVWHGFATHFHIDHAGAAQDLKAEGMRLVVTPEQVPFIDGMARYCKPTDHFTPITTHDNIVVPLDESRAFLATIGVNGELIATPGHSDDCVTLVLDTGEAFTGDLTPEWMAGPDELAVVQDSWSRLRDAGARMIYPGHASIRPMP